MQQTIKWRTGGVTVIRAAALAASRAGPTRAGRATAFAFAGLDGAATWLGTVTLDAAARTGAHHHDRTEVGVYVAQGRGRIRWGERLEFAAEVATGDFIYFAPYVPHQEENLCTSKPLAFVVVRSNSEAIAVNLDIVPVDQPETVA